MLECVGIMWTNLDDSHFHWYGAALEYASLSFY